jgi:hypothetical protein
VASFGFFACHVRIFAKSLHAAQLSSPLDRRWRPCARRPSRPRCEEYERRRRGEGRGRRRGRGQLSCAPTHLTSTPRSTCVASRSLETNSQVAPWQGSPSLASSLELSCIRHTLHTESSRLWCLPGHALKPTLHFRPACQSERRLGIEQNEKPKSPLAPYFPDVKCQACNTLLYKYRKGGKGSLVKCYLERITADMTTTPCECPG